MWCWQAKKKAGMFSDAWNQKNQWRERILNQQKLVTNWREHILRSKTNSDESSGVQKVRNWNNNNHGIPRNSKQISQQRNHLHPIVLNHSLDCMSDLCIVPVRVGYMARKWICISLDSQLIVLMDLIQRWNPTSPCLKLHAYVSQFFGTKRTHSLVRGLKEEALFPDFKFFLFFSSCFNYINLY